MAGGCGHRTRSEGPQLSCWCEARASRAILSASVRPVGMWPPHGADQARGWPGESHEAPCTYVHALLRLGDQGTTLGMSVLPGSFVSLSGHMEVGRVGS